MNTIRTTALAACALAALLAATPSLAATCKVNDRDQWTRDAQALVAAQDAFQATGFEGLRAEMGSLEAVVGHAPADAAEVAACGLTTDQWDHSPYPMATMLLGSARIEFGRAPEAEQALRRGLLMLPHSPMLGAEAATALVMQRRFQDVLVLTDAVVSGAPALEEREHARLLRVRGYALVELNRYDDAEAAYREAIRLDPSNTSAPQELEYLRQLRAGGEHIEGGVINTPPPRPVPTNPGT
jgi:tetratricopeptide (TPR) repeat protein